MLAEEALEGVEAPMVDCRDCYYFRKASDMSEDLRQQWTTILARYGKDLLGWCEKRGKPITYYKGKCRLFRRKPVKQYTLTGEIIELWW